MSSSRGVGGAWVALAGAGLLVLAACQSEGGATADAEEAPATSAVAAAPAAAPDTTGAAMWAHLQESDYQDNWELWPGTMPLYEGQQPHGMKLTMYVNDLALNALHAGASAMPDGAIVVKENYMPDGTLAAVTTMYKRSGYNPEHHDWFFTKHLASGELDQAPNGMALEGRPPGCQGCHIARADNDYLFAELGG